MRILFPYESYVPNAHADAEVFIHTASSLLQHHHEGTLVVPRSGSEQGDLSAQVAAYFGTDPSLKVCSRPYPIQQKTLRHLFHAVDVARGFSPNDYDLVYTQHLAALSAALRAGHLVVYDHYRPFGDQFPFLQPMLRNVMTHPNFLGAILHSELAARRYERLGIPSERLRAIVCAYDPRRLEPRLESTEARRKLGLPSDRKIAVYTGRVSSIKGLDVVLDMARSCSDVLFVLVGSEGRGPVEIAAEPLENVLVVPWQTFTETAPYLFAADVLLVPPSSEPLERFGRTVLPLKTFLYLGAGRAILAGDNPDIRGLLVHDKNAWLVPPGDTSAAVRGLRLLMNDESKRHSLAGQARELAQTLTWDARATRVDEFLRERWHQPRVRARASGFSWKRCAVETTGWFRQGITEGNWVYQRAGSS